MREVESVGTLLDHDMRLRPSKRYRAAHAWRRCGYAPYSAISAGTLAGPASGFSSISSISSVAVAISAAAAPNT